MITGYFGLPGSGKTTFLTRIAQKELKRIRKGKSLYDRVLTNFHCTGCYKIDYKDLGTLKIENALILLDEITLDADSRDFKQFDKAHKEFFLLHRHYGCDIVYFTQMYDAVDKKIRDITHSLYFVKSFRIFPKRKLFQISYAKRIYRQLDINEYTKEIVSGYRFPNLFDKLVDRSTLQLCFRPAWYKYFDTTVKSEKYMQIKPAYKIYFTDEMYNSIYNRHCNGCIMSDSECRECKYHWCIDEFRRRSLQPKK